MQPEETETIQEIILYLQTIMSRGMEQAAKMFPELPESCVESGDLNEFCTVFHQFMAMLHTSYDFQKKIAAGDLTAEVNKMNFLAMPLRALQASLRHLTWQASQVANGNLRQTVHFLGEFADSFNAMISALKEKELMQTRLLQAQKMESVGQLAAGIAHEINTPAQFINTNLDFIRESFEEIQTFIRKLEKQLPALPAQSAAELTDALEEADWEYLNTELPLALNQSKEGIERIRSIVLAMKSFSHPISREMAPVDLNQLMQTTMTISSNEWQYIAAIETDFASDLPLVPVLADETGQVLLNILVNAAYAIRERYHGEPGKGRIQISTRRDKEQVELRLTDNGVGMSDAVRQRIFEPFFTTREVGQGSGQGMAISYDVVVNKHGGSLECVSKTGEGTTIILRLPLQRKDPKT